MQKLLFLVMKWKKKIWKKDGRTLTIRNKNSIKDEEANCSSKMFVTFCFIQNKQKTQ